MASVKTVGNSGQVSLGKEYAGRHVLIDQIEKGVWIIKAGTFVPDNESWLQDAEVSEELQKAVSWAEQNPPRETSLDELEAKLGK
jgi:hypothetical protein